MNMKQVTGIYFSPTGHSKKVVRVIVSRLGGNTEYLDLTDAGKRPDYHFHENEVVVVGAPVYGGRLPQTAVESFMGTRLRQFWWLHTATVIMMMHCWN